jgi:murein DD-endopeptidase MepM/ murein hydrolase activator NlpD
VAEGDPIGTVSNFSRRLGLTSTHLHFEIQVPTRDGWMRVNPYMTLVASYEHLIGGRGKALGSEDPPPRKNRRARPMTWRRPKPMAKRSPWRTRSGGQPRTMTRPTK